MPLLRIPVRSAVVASRVCTRGLATNSATSLLDTLGQSSVLRASQEAAEVSKDPTLGTKLGAIAFAGHEKRESAKNIAARERADYQKHIYRKWNTGDVYAPHDLSGVEQKKFKLARKAPSSDAFDTLGINPVNEYKNFTMMSEYMTEMGRIKHSRDTGLRPKNQRKIAKAIRRAVGLGLMPSVHRHPLVLKNTSASRFAG